jgi:hypothetical protein
LKAISTRQGSIEKGETDPCLSNVIPLCVLTLTPVL